MSSGYFNICTENEIRNVPGYYKNIDDVLVSANNMGMLEERMEKMLKVSLRKNMKLHPDKLQIGRKLTFGGVTIEAWIAEGDTPSILMLDPS